ncbi:MAG: hemolysin family protein [Bacteroidales bacterium]|jgi:CBS domain containing-hemolysin-like protein|nr:hemolysin family protein [Bacteroidales bacterium]
MLLLFLYLFLALFTSFLCSILEAVLLTTSTSFLVVKREEGCTWASPFIQLKENIDKPLSAILSLNTIAHTVGAAGVGAQAIIVFGEGYLGLVSAILTFMILIFTEIIPKTIGTIYHKSLAHFATYTIRTMIIVIYPLVFISAFISKLFTKSHQEQRTSREEISALTSMGADDGIFSENEKQMIQNILKLKQIRVSEVMTPRKVVSMANEETSCEEFMEKPQFKPFSRIVLCAGSEERITGYVLRQSVLAHLAEDKKDISVKHLKHNIIAVPNTAPLFSVWEHLLNRREHICLVVDEHGDMEGLVTMEDIIETIIGLEIVDETDTIPDLQQFARENAK